MWGGGSVLGRLASRLGPLPKPVLGALDALTRLRRIRGAENTAADLLMGLGLLWRLREGRIIARVTPRGTFAVSAAAAAAALSTSRALYAGAGTASLNLTPLDRKRRTRATTSVRDNQTIKTRRRRQPPVTQLCDEGELRALSRLAAWANASYEVKPDTSLPRNDDGSGGGARILSGPFAATDTLPAYIVGVDEALNAIVVSIRGSTGWGEALVSMQAVPVDIAGGTAHRGILSAADALVSTLASGIAGASAPRRETLASLTARAGLVNTTTTKTTTLIMCGHSLGAAVASLAALRLQSCCVAQPSAFPFSKINAVTYCAPPCVSPALAKSMSKYTTVVVSGDDAVPRMHLGAVRRLRAELASVDWAQEIASALATATERSLRALTFGAIDTVVAIKVATAARELALGLSAAAVAPTALVLGVLGTSATRIVLALPVRAASLLAVTVDVIVEWVRASVSHIPDAAALRATGSALASAATAVAGVTGVLRRNISTASASASPPLAPTAAGITASVSTPETPFHWSDLVHCVPGRVIWVAYPGGVTTSTSRGRGGGDSAAPRTRALARAAKRAMALARTVPLSTAAATAANVATAAAAAAAGPPPQAKQRRRGAPLFLVVHYPDEGNSSRSKSGAKEKVHAVPVTAPRTAADMVGRMRPLWRRAALPAAYAVLAARLRRADKKAARLDAAAFAAECAAAYKIMDSGATAAGQAALASAERVAAAVGGRAKWPHRHLSLLEMSHSIFSDHLISTLQTRFELRMRRCHRYNNKNDNKQRRKGEGERVTVTAKGVI